MTFLSFQFCSFTRASLALVALAALLTSVGCEVTLDSQGYTAREEKRFTVSGTPDVMLATFDGSIEVRAWDRPEVLVEIEKRGGSKEAIDGIDIVAEQTGGRIHVEARRPIAGDRLFGIGRSRTARLVASVPRQTNLMARSGDGSISVERIDGRIDLRTGDGSISGFDLGGELTVNTGDGSVKLEGVQGKLELKTGDGGVTVAGKLQAVRLHTGDGAISLRAEPGSVMSEDWDIQSGDGGVVVYLPPQFDADLDAETNDGTVRTDRDISVKTLGETNRRTLRGKLGLGGRTLRVRTGDGSISVRAS